MATWIGWTLRIGGLAFLAVGLIVLVTGDSSWLGSSPELAGGPPTLIAGAVMCAIGLLLLLAARYVARKAKGWLLVPTDRGDLVGHPASAVTAGPRLFRENNRGTRFQPAHPPVGVERSGRLTWTKEPLAEHGDPRVVEDPGDHQEGPPWVLNACSILVRVSTWIDAL